MSGDKDSKFEKTFAAAAFAEANEHDEALRWPGDKKAPRNREDTLAEFLEKVGLEEGRPRKCPSLLWRGTH